MTKTNINPHFYIYKLYFKNGETYIGCHVQRFLEDRYVTSSSFYKTHKNELINREILVSCKDKETMDIMETICIMGDKADNPKNVNFNYGNWLHKFIRKDLKQSDITKRKISEKNKGKPAWNKGLHGIYTEESIRKMSERAKGRPAWNKGLPGRKHTASEIEQIKNYYTEEVLRLHSERIKKGLLRMSDNAKDEMNKKRSLSYQSKSDEEKNSIHQKKRDWYKSQSEDYKRLKAEKHSECMRGRKFTDEHKYNLQLSYSKRVGYYWKDINTGKTYITLKLYAEEVGLTQKTVEKYVRLGKLPNLTKVFY